MSFTTPTIDVYLPGTTLGIGNVNAGTINIGKGGTQINVGGSMNVTNTVTTPSCGMTSLTTTNLSAINISAINMSVINMSVINLSVTNMSAINMAVINMPVTNMSAINMSVTNISATNASFQTFNSTNILIGPYPQNGTFNTLNVTNPTITNLNSTNLNSTNLYSRNASLNILNVSNFLITPLNSNPTFATITSPSIIATDIDVAPNTTLTLGNQNATSVYIGSSGTATRNVTNYIGTGSGSGSITIGNNTNSIQLNGSINIGTGKNITLQPASGYVSPTAGTMLGGITTAVLTSITLSFNQQQVGTITVPATGIYILSYSVRLGGSSGTVTIFQTWFDQSPTLNQSGMIANTASQSVSSNAFPCNSTSCVSLLTSGTLTLNIYSQGSGTITTTGSSYMAITRLA